MMKRKWKRKGWVGGCVGRSDPANAAAACRKSVLTPLFVAVLAGGYYSVRIAAGRA